MSLNASPLVRPRRALYALLLSTTVLSAGISLLNFERFADSTPLTTQYPGFTFTNTIILTAGISLNEFEFPPHSSSNVASDNGGPITITFSTPVESFGAYFTYGEALTVQAFNSSNQPIASGRSQFSNNEVLSGASGSAPNEFIQVANSAGIASVTITGDPNGSSFAMDDVTIGSPCNLNGLGAANLSDVQLVINQALGQAQPANDLSGDGNVNVVDVQIAIEALFGFACPAGSHALTATRLSFHPRPSRVNRDEPRAAMESPLAAVRDLGTLGGVSTVANGLNNLGQVVGASDTGEHGGHGAVCGDGQCPIRHAFLWDSGQMVDLGWPVGAMAIDSEARAINDTGQVVGGDSYPGYSSAGFLYFRQGMTALPGNAAAINGGGRIAADAGAQRTAALHLAGINDRDELVGLVHLSADQTTHAFLFSAGKGVDLGTLGGTNSAALGINNAGLVVGFSEITGDASRHAFLYDASRMTDLGTLGGPESQADGINSRGQVVGRADNPDGESHAVLWCAGHAVDLNGIAAIGKGAVLVEATAINDGDQVVANGSNGRAYLIALPAGLCSAGGH